MTGICGVLGERDHSIDEMRGDLSWTGEEQRGRFVDERVAVGWSCIGSGLRRSKLFVTGDLLVALPGAEVVEGLAVPA